ncbi:hypothetical protein SEA_ODESZA_41 [Gordonia Phage Odesza]|uniref:Uncharacterized protein n=5 Tax=Tanisvirus tanis TaxID=2844677 RepID=A0A7D5JSF8_9CAUD|nr:hypothetical protein HWC73_gp42 [Gordonia phage Tanis]AVO25281.1 hypothetical protein PBI_GRAVY_41 [Gordonia phage Gravy]AVO25374.1 hypothetical protein PBI_KERRY_41 [Gordonia phage Kerry]QGJ89652.1 hypothetical protein SEA_ODESZA_41 [Gordonia Phage Odesza]QKY78714.1 hypothetical protein SEA_GILL_42 [Gordonia phage Gill]QLF83759.1 hypothetical protein SEA_MAGEL_43 [Gordonia phage Magel]
MLRQYREITKLTMLGALVVETAILIRMAYAIKEQNLTITTLENVSRYYVDMLDKNDVPLTDYDIIALNAILTKHPAIQLDTGE